MTCEELNVLDVASASVKPGILSDMNTTVDWIITEDKISQKEHEETISEKHYRIRYIILDLCQLGWPQRMLSR